MSVLPLLLLCFLPSLVLSSSVPNAGLLDFHELQALQYNVVIDARPIRNEQDKEAGEEEEGEDKPPSPTVVPMTNKFGQRYQCLLPDISDQLELAEEKEKNEMSSETLTRDIKELLSPMGKSAQCLIKTKDWWTYEYCHGQAIRQYHVEDGKPSGKILTLGKYERDIEWTDEARTNDALKYHTQYYTNGTECDLTGNLRKTEVKFYCDTNAMLDQIVQIEEPLSCEYVIKIVTSKICSLPKFKPEPTTKPKEIKCHPILSSEEYEKYEVYEKEREKLAQIKLKEQREKQKTQMLNLIGDQDLTDIDINTDEGFQIIEGMVDEKVAETLVSQLQTLLSPGAEGQMKHGFGTFSLVSLEDFKHNVLHQSKKGQFMDIVNEVVRKGKEKKKMEEQMRKVGKEEATRKRKMAESAARFQQRQQEKDREIRERKARMEKESFDLEAERKVRSDAVTEEDMMDELDGQIESLDPKLREEVESLLESNEFKRDLEGSLEDIVRETQQETGARLSPEQRVEIKQMMDSIGSWRDTKREMEGNMDAIKEKETEIERIDAEMKEKEKKKEELERELRETSEGIEDEDGGLIKIITSSGPSDEEELLAKGLEYYHTQVELMTKFNNGKKLEEDVLGELREHSKLMARVLLITDAIKAARKNGETARDVNTLVSKRAHHQRRLNARSSELRRKVQEEARNREMTPEEEEYIDRENEKAMEWLHEQRRKEQEAFKRSMDATREHAKSATNVGQGLDAGLGAEREHYKHDGTLSKKRELREEDYYEDEEDDEEEIEDEDDEEEDDDVEASDEAPTPFKESSGSHVQVQVTDISPRKLASLSDLDSDDKVTKRLENVIKSKLARSGLDTGGRQIEVKLVTTTINVDDDEALAIGGGGGADGDENVQFQNMIYSLMSGDQNGFRDIENQRVSERNYKFQWDEKLLEETRSLVSKSKFAPKEEEGEATKDETAA